MKTKIILIIAISAIATLSFSFSFTDQKVKAVVQHENTNINGSEPLGGFVSEDKF